MLTSDIIREASLLAHVMACHLLGAKSLPELTITYHLPEAINFKIESVSKMQNGGYFIQVVDPMFLTRVKFLRITYRWLSARLQYLHC